MKQVYQLEYEGKAPLFETLKALMLFVFSQDSISPDTIVELSLLVGEQLATSNMTTLRMVKEGQTVFTEYTLVKRDILS